MKKKKNTEKQHVFQPEKTTQIIQESVMIHINIIIKNLRS